MCTPASGDPVHGFLVTNTPNVGTRQIYEAFNHQQAPHLYGSYCSSPVHLNTWKSTSWRFCYFTRHAQNGIESDGDM